MLEDCNLFPKSSDPPPRGSSETEVGPARSSETEVGLPRGEPPRSPTGDLYAKVPAPKLEPAVAAPPPLGLQAGQVQFAGGRAALVAALRRRDEGAAVAFFHEFAPLVERTLGRIVGVDSELPDATQEVFLRALRSMHRLRDPQALTDWVLQITVCTATDWVRRRQRRRWLLFFDPAELRSPEISGPDDVSREALRATYRVLDRLSAEDRMVFALRYIEGMELTQVASACSCSLATVKRRLGRASDRFRAHAKREPALIPWLRQAGDRNDPNEQEGCP